MAIGLALALLGGLAAAQDKDGGAAAPHAHGDHPAAAAETPFSRGMSEAMDRMMASMHGEAETGDPDVDFLAMMIPHHQGAIDMAELVLRHGRDPLVRQLAESIIATQQAEIAAMTARLERLRSGGTSETEYPLPFGARGPVPRQ